MEAPAPEPQNFQSEEMQSQQPLPPEPLSPEPPSPESLSPNPLTAESLTPAAAIPGLPADCRLVLQPQPDPMAKVAGLKVLGNHRSAASLGLFMVLLVGFGLTVLAIGEALQLTFSNNNTASPLLDYVMALTVLLLIIAPVLLAALLGISLGQAIRQPRHGRSSDPGLERCWQLQRGNQTLGSLRLLPEVNQLRLLWIKLQPAYRNQGAGQAFLRAVLQAEGQRCRVKLPREGEEQYRHFFQRCGFLAPVTEALREQSQGEAGRRSRWSKPRETWMTYDPKAPQAQPPSSADQLSLF